MAEKDELTDEQREKLEAEANEPSKGKYEDLTAHGKKGKNKKPLISSGQGYEVTLNKKK